MVPYHYTEVECVTDAVRVALLQCHVDQADVLVHQERSRAVHLPTTTVIRIRVLLPRWDMRRVWWWWLGGEASYRVERHIRHVLSSIEGLQYTAAMALLFITLDTPPRQPESL